MIYCILGQTASGKTSLALSLAREFSMPIISADAFQCFKKMQIGTDKPTREEVGDLEYYFYDEYDPDYDMTVYEFQNRMRPVLDQFVHDEKDVIIVGGTFLYIKALLFNYVFEQENREEKDDYDSMSLEDMCSLLREKSPAVYESIDIHNPRRVIRALRQIDSGKTREDILKENDGTPIYPVTFLRINVDKDIGNALIDRRVDQMKENGLLQEIQMLVEEYGYDIRPLTAIGYREIVELMKDGKKIDDNAYEAIKIHTHQYAKKQRTFLNHQFPDVKCMSKEEIRSYIRNELRLKALTRVESK